MSPGEGQDELSRFLSRAVLPVTSRLYEGQWKTWRTFLREELRMEDPFLRGLTEERKVDTVARYLYSRYQDGKRGKIATAVTAGLRFYFNKAREAVSFLDSPVIAMARTACRMNPAEARAKKDRGPAETVKLPVCEEILTDMRVHCWGQLEWCPGNIERRMVYIACMYGYDLSARISEYTVPEPGATDHCVRLNDLTFVVSVDGGVESVAGGRLASLGLTAPPGGNRGLQRVVECRILTSTSKGKSVVKPKLIGRRSPEEAQFLEDLAAFISHSGGAGKEELFSCRGPTGVRVALKGRDVREELKAACKARGLPQEYFSSHSLRKGAITHMRATGATEDDRRDRGNYAPGSQVMNSTYDYAIGLGPLASNSLTGGYRPDLQDLRRLIPPTPCQEE